MDPCALYLSRSSAFTELDEEFIYVLFLCILCIVVHMEPIGIIFTYEKNANINENEMQ